MIRREEITKNQKIPEEFEENLQTLLIALNRIRPIYDKPMLVTSGYRTKSYNKCIGGTPKSPHLFCQAADFKDSGGFLAAFCQNNLGLLEQSGLWMENPLFTRGWVHLDTVYRKNRIFNP